MSAVRVRHRPPAFALRASPGKPTLYAKAALVVARRAETGCAVKAVKYVYLLESVEHPTEKYIGLTDDLQSRFSAHNADARPILPNSPYCWRRFSVFTSVSMVATSA